MTTTLEIDGKKQKSSSGSFNINKKCGPQSKIDMWSGTKP